MEWLVPIITQIVSGIAGGQIAGIKNNLSLGRTGNSVAGGIGGLLLGQLSAYVASTHGNEVTGHLLAQILGSGLGGVVLTALTALVRNMINKNNNINTKL